MRRQLLFGVLFVVVLVAACSQPETVTETIEVTRVVTETVEVEGETVEVTVVVTESEEVVVEVTREVEVEAEAPPSSDEESDDWVPLPTALPTMAFPTAFPPGTPAPPEEADQSEDPGDGLDVEPSGNTFEDYGVNPFVDTLEDPLSTFSVDVDTGSYTVARGYLLEGFLPPSEAIRVEEFVNYFDQEYALPEEGAFAIDIEGAPSPFGEGDDYQLVRVGIQGYDVAPEDRPDANLIFVIDVSGSMDAENRLSLVKEALTILVQNLRVTDRVAIIAYGSSARIVLEPTFAVADDAILAAIDGLQTEGSTNVEQGLMLAYQLADQIHEEGHITRLILCSDGVANVGSTTAETILQHGENGVPLNSYGFGLGGYNDVLMEQLADQGNGSYAYIDTIEEANRVFEEQLTASIFTIAKDTKVQVEFNPTVVSQYRLLGYENREVADSDFRNDEVDAGEIGAGHSVTAIYEVRLVDGAPQAQAALTVRVRYENPETEEVQEIARSIAIRDFAESFESASPRFQLAAVVAEFAEILRNSYWAQDSDMEGLAGMASQLAELFPDDPYVQDFADLVVLAAGLAQ